MCFFNSFTQLIEAKPVPRITIFEFILNELEKGDDVKISSFGTFSVRHKKSRIGRNPKTGVEVPITERNVVSFSSSNVLKSSFKS